jgi:hypothetical protein
MRRVRAMTKPFRTLTTRSYKEAAYLLHHFAGVNDGLSVVKAAKNAGLVNEVGRGRRSNVISVKDAARLMLVALVYPGQHKKSAVMAQDALLLKPARLGEYAPFVLTPDGEDALLNWWPSAKFDDAFSYLLAALVLGNRLNNDIDGELIMRPRSPHHSSFVLEMRVTGAARPPFCLSYFGPVYSGQGTWTTLENRISFTHLARAADFLAGRSDRA